MHFAQAASARLPALGVSHRHLARCRWSGWGTNPVLMPHPLVRASKLLSG